MKVLCLGDNSSHHAWAHTITKQLAQEERGVFRGMVPADSTALQDGYYHVGPVSMQPRDIVEACKNFDRVVLLDQEQDKYSDHRIFLAMFKLVNDMKDMGTDVEIQNKDNMEYLYYWTRLYNENKSICVYPWILRHDGYGDYTSLCGRATKPVAKTKDLTDWGTNKNYQEIRNSMLDGVRVDNCWQCHKYEDTGIKDQRWNYSFDWIAKLKLKRTKINRR